MFLTEVLMTSNNNNLISILLNRNVISINQNDTVYDAINILSKKKIGALPVLNDQNKLCGMLSERDIIRRYPMIKK